MSGLGDEGFGRYREEPFPEDGSPPVDVPVDLPVDVPADPALLVDPDNPAPADWAPDSGDPAPPDLGWGPLFEGDPGNPSGDEGAE